MTEIGCTGRRIHDANVVATAISYSIDSIVTANVADFSGLSDDLQIVDLRDVELRQ